MTIQEIFEGMKATFAERNKTYGDSYRQTGVVLQALFPKGLTLETIDEWQRFGTFFMIICKAVRYAEQMKTGGHIDSAHDSAVYSAILEELTRVRLHACEPAPIEKKQLYKYVVLFRSESPLSEKFCTFEADYLSESKAYDSAFELYGHWILAVHLAHHVKINQVYDLTEIVFGEMRPV